MVRANISKGLIANQNQGGGSNKAGIPSSIGRTRVLINAIRTSAYNGLEIGFSSPTAGYSPPSAEFTGTWASADDSLTLVAGQQYEDLIVPNTSTLKWESSETVVLITDKVDLKLSAASDPGIPDGSATVIITF